MASPFAAFRTKSVLSATSGATQDITISGLTVTPKAAMIVATRVASLTSSAAHGAQSIGVTDGTYQGGISRMSEDNLASSNTFRMCFDNALVRGMTTAGAAEATFTFNSFITGGIRINLSLIPGTQWVLDVTLWYGADLQAKAGAAQPPAQGSAPAHTSTVFPPDQLLTFNTTDGADETARADLMFQVGMYANGFTGRSLLAKSDDNQSTMHPGLVTGQAIGAYFSGANAPFLYSESTELTSFDATGFNLQTTGGTGGGFGPSFVYLALSYGGKSFSLSLEQTPTSASSQTLTGLATGGGYVMSLQTIVATNWNGNDVSTNRAGVLGIGTFSADEACTAFTTDEDEAADSNTSSQHSSSALRATDHDGTTVIYDATLTNFTGDGMVLNFSTGNATRRKWACFLLELDPFVLSGSGSVPAIGGSGVAKEVFRGTASGAVTFPSGSGIAKEVFRGTGSGSVPFVAGSGVAKEVFRGTASGAVTFPSGSGVAKEVFRGTASGSVPFPSISGIAKEVFRGTASGAVTFPGGSGVAKEVFRGTASGSITFPSGGGTAIEVFRGTASGAVTFPSGGGIAKEVFRGDASGAVPFPSGSGSATQAFTSTGSGVVPFFAGTGIALEVFRGTASGAVPFFTGSGIATVIDSTPPEESDLECPTDLVGEYGILIDLEGSSDVVAELLGSSDVVTEFLGSSHVTSDLQGSSDVTVDLLGSPC